MRPDVRTFTKDNPCTKRDLWECFRGPRGFVSVQVTVAYSIIGVNAPRVMERNGYLTRSNTAQGDYFTLTDTGRAWLTKGIQSYMRNHPAQAHTIPYPSAAAEAAAPASAPMGRRIRRR